MRAERYLYSLVVQSVYNHNISLELCFLVVYDLARYYFFEIEHNKPTRSWGDEGIEFSQVYRLTLWASFL